MRARAFAFMLLCSAAAFAWAEAPTAWSYEAVSASPRWVDFNRRLRENALRPVDDAQVANRCRAVLDAVKDQKGDDDAVDLCITVVLELAAPGSNYLTPAEMRKSRIGRGPFVGIGLELGGKSPGRGLLVVTPIAGAPSERGGIRPKDVIVEIDGVDILPLTMDQTIAQLRGEMGSTLTLKLLRGNDPTPLALSMKREEIRVASVRHKRVQGNLAYLRISQFGEATPRDFARAVDVLAAPDVDGARPRGLVLDLRNNPGGQLESVLSIGQAFADAGTPIATLTQRDGVSSLTGGTGAARLPPPRLSQAGHDWLMSVPVAVLVDDKTFSAAELLAQFLREHAAAALIGRPTGGLASLRSAFSLSGDAAVQMVVGELSSPQGVRWAGTGLTPDVEVAELPDDRADPALERALQALPGLRREGRSAAGYAPAVATPQPVITPPVRTWQPPASIKSVR